MDSTTGSSDNFSFEIVPLDEENERIVNDFKGYIGGAVQVGPERYFFLNNFHSFGKQIYNFELKDSDVFVATFPRCGTTWMQEMVWMLINDFYYEGGQVNLDIRFPFVDADLTVDARVYELPQVKKFLKIEDLPKPGDRLNMAVTAKSPRCLKTHMPFSLLPPKLLDTCKVIYVVRDPRDVVVSLYGHHFMIRSFGFDGTFETFFEYFISDKVIFAPFWSHVREAWKLRTHPNLLFIKYEDMKKDLTEVILKVTKFLGKSITVGQLEKLVQHLDIDSMKNNLSTNGEEFVKTGLFKETNEGFIRSGKSGGWRNVLTDDMKKRIKQWSTEGSKGLDKVLGYC